MFPRGPHDPAFASIDLWSGTGDGYGNRRRNDPAVIAQITNLVTGAPSPHQATRAPAGPVVVDSCVTGLRHVWKCPASPRPQAFYLGKVGRPIMPAVFTDKYPWLTQVVDKLDSKTPRLCKPYRDTFVGVVSSGIVRELFSLHHVDPEIASISDAPHLEKIVPTIEYTTVPFRNLCLYEQISHVASLFAGEQSTIAYHLKVDLNKEDPKA
ncbi:hypothetical protein HPB51_000589 [Rhipicephalus microplus]|uniref:Uncharacterized protein n=1 Tax=Rhipicephalus microplus TaxID=6941 RepID=A0A9J6DYM1_RHIMP|nr:hypothetical protein HPB51_000589 [Rhipicephalus microplus]